ncbi:class I SAM-dependent methyltransferase [Pendulispora brunnea]|uniref:S-adenosyl-L-methionine-dependent methyltransferase n=1 Tax=Pendulispora brunnea TaxID=2905690 RepID=A0ABZ2KB97_9BACT
MRDNQSSSTAIGVAMQRAAHQLFDRPLVFEDPLAIRLTGSNDELLDFSKLDERETRHIRAFLAARSRYTEEAFEAAFSRGVRQYVVLGAGFDTFAYRHRLEEVRVLEVDHPATQARKRELLGNAGIAVPPSLTYVPVDFEKDTLRDALIANGFHFDESAFFCWLGVTMYLTRAAIMDTLGMILQAARGTEVVFDYQIDPASLDARDRAIVTALTARVAKLGEPWISHFLPESLMQDLRAMGFRHVESIGPQVLRALYFRNREDGLSVSNRAHLMHARV